MTREQLDKMTDEEMREKIAILVLGFNDFDWLVWCDEENCPPWEGRKLHGSKSDVGDWIPVPDYLNSLDACHEMEKVLWERNDWSACKYQETLRKRVMASESWTWHATARQRCLAFLLTLG